MYTPHNNNKFNTKSNIIQIAQQIQQQTQYQNEALSIINAYRKIENIPIIHSNHQIQKKQPSKSSNHQPSSQYSNKVKQTLKQLNVNKKKLSHPNQDLFKNHTQQYQHIINPTQKHLIQSGLKHLFKVLNKKYEQYKKIFIQSLIRNENQLFNKQQKKIINWKLKRILSAWHYQIMLIKIQKQRKQKQQQQKYKKKQQLSINFYYFFTCKKVIKLWSQQTKKIIKKKLLLKQQLIQKQIIQKQKQKQKQKIYILQNNTKSPTINNIQLQNKVRGFLDDLKLSVQNKNKLNIIHEKQQQSNYHQNLSNCQNIPSSNNNKEQVSQNLNQQTFQPKQNQLNIPTNIIGIQQQIEIETQHKGALTNQDLQKRRKQFEKKSKHRKQILDRLKRQKEQKKKQLQQQKNRIQKQLQIQQKKIKKQLYLKFIKQKKIKQQWQIKQKLLNKQAQQFNTIRLLKYYGWIYWIKLKSVNQSNISNLLFSINQIFIKYYLQKFCQNVMIIGQQKLQELQQKMIKYHSRKLKRKCINRFKQNKQIELVQKLQYQTRHQVFTLKIYFTSWLRSRQSIQLQNYQWQRPRIKKAQLLHNLTLFQKSFQGFKLNRDQSIQNKNIQQHKAKIKKKVISIVQEKPTINYDDFL